MAKFKRVKLRELKVNFAERGIRNVSSRYGVTIEREFDKVTQSWEGEKPDFKPIQSTRGDEFVTTIVATGSDIAVKKMTWLDDGTPPHEITAKNYPTLGFRLGYKRKTAPRVIGSTSGGAFGSKVRAKTVNHPGTPEGAFAETIEQQQGPKYQKDIEKVAVNL